jgi:hypothetical protein
LEFSLCDIESYRLQGNGSTCTSSCGDDELIEFDELHCFDPSVYPTDLWTDSDNVMSANQFSCRSCWQLSNQCRSTNSRTTNANVHLLVNFTTQGEG